MTLQKCMAVVLSMLLAACSTSRSLPSNAPSPRATHTSCSSSKSIQMAGSPIHGSPLRASTSRRTCLVQPRTSGPGLCPWLLGRETVTRRIKSATKSACRVLFLLGMEVTPFRVRQAASRSSVGASASRRTMIVGNWSGSSPRSSRRWMADRLAEASSEGSLGGRLTVAVVASFLLPDGDDVSGRSIR